MQNIDPKIQDKINTIIKLQTELLNWREKDESEIQNLMRDFEKMPRMEMTVFYEEYFTNQEFAAVLLEIAKEYPNNQKMIINIISSLGMMILRYRLKETKEIYNFMLMYSARKNISPYVDIYLPDLKGFENCQNKWEYYMSMKEMTPKKIAHQRFLSIIKQNISDIPSKYKGEVVEFLEKRKETANNEYGKKMYSEMIEKIKEL